MLAVKMGKISLTDYLGQNSLHEGCAVNTMIEEKKHLIVNKSGAVFFPG